MWKEVKQSYMFRTSVSVSSFFQAKDQDSLSERTKASKNQRSAACLLAGKDLFLLFVFKIWHEAGFQNPKTFLIKNTQRNSKVYKSQMSCQGWKGNQRQVSLLSLPRQLTRNQDLAITLTMRLKQDVICCFLCNRCMH